ncbi:MAG: histidinol-phosphate transaminase [Eggerthellaceae bacterium]|nr:histidinol-phosphate transaminase [Eggerthellaceae bacterium]
MSKYLSQTRANLTPYVPGEQPVDIERYIKLNTNESPFRLSKAALAYAFASLRPLQLYPDPEYGELRRAFAESIGVSADEVMAVNGSDEALYLAFSAFCDEKTPAVFADITYGFYPVFADMCRIPYETIPLTDDLQINPEDYLDAKGTIFIANPNAPTGVLLGVSDIERIIESNPENVVVIDEAYIDFGGETVVPLIRKYDNLLVTRTFSKSRSLAGARLGFAIGCTELIADLNTLRNSINPYNVNNATVAYGLGSLADDDAFRDNCTAIEETRAFTVDGLKTLGFEMPDSYANFVFARTPKMAGGELYHALKERGILVRHFDNERICDYNRISIGTPEQMQTLLDTLKELLG